MGVEYSFWNKYRAEMKDEGFHIYPRIMIGNVILDRKTWGVPKEWFSFDNDTDSFLSNIDIIKNNGIDDEVFLRISTTIDSFQEEYISSDFDTWMKEVKNTKLRKPQYINFKSYFHQQMAKKMIEQARKDVVFQEILPKGENSIKGATNAVEFLIEV